MMDARLFPLLAGRERMSLPLEKGCELNLLSASEILEISRQAEELSQNHRERALCSNACLIARALTRAGKPVFPSGQDVLEHLRVEEIAALSQLWADFNRRENPSPEDPQENIDALKKAWGTRPMNALNGACSKLLACFRPHKRQNP